jgi:hypothetical protein
MRLRLLRQAPGDTLASHAGGSSRRDGHEARSESGEAFAVGSARFRLRSPRKHPSRRDCSFRRLYFGFLVSRTRPTVSGSAYWVYETRRGLGQTGFLVIEFPFLVSRTRPNVDRRGSEAPPRASVAIGPPSYEVGPPLRASKARAIETAGAPVSNEAPSWSVEARLSSSGVYLDDVRASFPVEDRGPTSPGSRPACPRARPTPVKGGFPRPMGVSRAR